MIEVLDNLGNKYEGNWNFEKGHKQCNQCKGIMNRKPLDYSYIPYQGNYLLVKHHGSELIVSEADPEWIWTCTKCVYCESPNLIK